jgi:uncharacterized protein with NRDE domain
MVVCGVKQLPAGIHSRLVCLIAIAHRASARYPLVIAANRDEDYERPSLPAGFWDDQGIAGGRDAVHGGSWLAINRNGRFAAVTNLRGSVRTTQPRSRGELVSDFVRGDEPAGAYLETIASRLHEYGGFIWSPVRLVRISACSPDRWRTWNLAFMA